MKAIHLSRITLLPAAALLVGLMAGCGGMEHHSDAYRSAPARLSLTGSGEVPPVSTAAMGSGAITVAADKSVSGSITTTGINATAAHIHMGAPGANGPVIIPLTKSGDAFSVPAGAKLTDEQYAAYKAGNLYVNVHSEANKGGEIRAQLAP